MRPPLHLNRSYIDMSTPASFIRPRLQPLTATAAASAAALSSAQAAIVYIDANDIVVRDTLTADGAYASLAIDLNLDAIVDIQLWHREDTTQNDAAIVVAPVNGSAALVGQVNGAFRYPSRIPAGGVIDQSAAFINVTWPPADTTVGWLADAGGFIGSQWAGAAPNNTGYLGLRFKIAGNDHFGWMRLTVNPSTGIAPRAITVHEYAYESIPGASIAAGQIVPEPGGLGLLALGSAGLAAHRRRRRE